MNGFFNNNRGKLIFAAALIVLLTAAIALIEFGRRGAANQAVSQIAQTSDFPRQIVDAGGNVLTIPARPARIASQTLATDEILLDICPNSQIVAVSDVAEDTDYSNVVAQAKQIPNRSVKDAEQILQARPDLIFVASYSRAETVELLKASNAPVFRFSNFDSIDDIRTNIKTVGAASGCDENAAKLLQQMNDELAKIKARIPMNQPQPRVMSFGADGYTAGKNTMFDSIAAAAGAINTSAEQGLTGFPKISGEKILEWQPDFIVTGARAGEAEVKKKQLLANPIIAASEAGKHGRIIVIETRYLLAVSQYVTHAVKTLAEELAANGNK